MCLWVSVFKMNILCVFSILRTSQIFFSSCCCCADKSRLKYNLCIKLSPSCENRSVLFVKQKTLLSLARWLGRVRKGHCCKPFRLQLQLLVFAKTRRSCCYESVGLTNMRFVFASCIDIWLSSLLFLANVCVRVNTCVYVCIL